MTPQPSFALRHIEERNIHIKHSFLLQQNLAQAHGLYRMRIVTPPPLTLQSTFANMRPVHIRMEAPMARTRVKR